MSPIILADVAPEPAISDPSTGLVSVCAAAVATLAALIVVWRIRRNRRGH